LAYHRIAVIGQAFPRTSNANPQKYFFPDWSFGLREDEMAELVADIRENEKPDAVSASGLIKLVIIGSIL
jgi:sulfur-oxidizing protein SoxB